MIICNAHEPTEFYKVYVSLPGCELQGVVCLPLNEALISVGKRIKAERGGLPLYLPSSLKPPAMG